MATDENEHEPATDSSSGILRWLILLFVILSIYILSVGPAVLLDKKGYLPRGVEAIYAPLETLSDKSETAYKFFEWYLKLWGADK